MKDNLLDIQKDIITKQKIQDANNANAYLDLVYLARVLDEERANKLLGIPFFARGAKAGRPDRMIESKSNINLTQFNDNINTLKSDTDTIIQGVGLAEKLVEQIDRSVTRASTMLKAAIALLDTKYKEHRKQVGIYRYAHREGISDLSNFDLANSTVDIDTQKHVIQSTKSNLFAGNIQIGLLSSEQLGAVSDDNEPIATDANFFKIFVPDNKETGNITVIKDIRSETRVTVSALLTDIPNMNINTLVIDTSHMVPTKTSISIMSEGKLVSVVSNQYLQNSIYTFTFDIIKADRIIVSMSQQQESSIDTNGRKTFLFRINSITPEYTNFAKDAQFVTNPIEVDFPITDISIESVDQRPVDTKINYYISKDKVTWTPITPRNLSPNAPNSIVNIGTSSFETIEYVESTVSHPWNTITPHHEYGNVALYNILEYCESPYIISGMLGIVAYPAEEEIVPDSLNVYRGIDDWAIEPLKYEAVVEVKDIMYRWKKETISGDISGSDYLHDILSQDAFTSIENEGHVVDVDGGTTLKYNPCNNNITIVNAITGRSVNIMSQIGTRLLLTGAPTGTKINVTYHTLITTIEETDKVIIEIDPATFKYKHNTIDNTFVNRNEVYYDVANRTVHVNVQNNALPTNEYGWVSAYVSFSYKKKAREAFQVYRTFVFYENETEITILPFTQEEIFANNFHIIDGINISTNSSYVMTGGWHEVITTQPYKTDPSNPLDTNMLTNRASDAGIILGEYTERRAYTRPMRQTSTHTLSNVLPPSSRENYAVADGQILFNFVPEYLPDNAVINATHLTGVKILAKEAEYYADGRYTFKQYIHKPEKFLVEYKTMPKEGSNNDVRTIYVKGELITNKKQHTSPSIFIYDVVFY